MLNIKLPKTRYNTTTYPNLEVRADGAPIPIAYGDLHGVIPICIDETIFKYKLAGHAIHAINTIKNVEKTLVLGSDYSVGPGVAEFTLSSTPYLKALTLYYFVIDGSYGPSGSNYVSFKRPGGAGYPDGNLFTINAGGLWTSVPASDLHYRISGKANLGDQEVVKVNTTSYSTSLGIGLNDDPARTRLAQSFITGADAYYLTRVSLWTKRHGNVTGNLRITILSEAGAPVGTGESRVGVQSMLQAINTNDVWHKYVMYFPLQNQEASLICNIEGANKTIGLPPPAVGATIIDGANFLEDLVVTRLGKTTAGLLDATALANFKAKRTQAIAAYIDRDTTFGEIVGKLESSLLFKFVPLHDGTYAPTVYEADTVEVRPHFFDEHFLSFSMRHDFSAVKTIVKVKYDENPGNNEFKVTEADSDVARFVYGVEDTLEVETYLKTEANAATLAADCLGMYETPPLEITFEIRDYGPNLIPGRDKVKITRTRAAYAGGALSGVLFRITKITKKRGTASTEIVAVQDDQTY